MNIHTTSNNVAGTPEAVANSATEKRPDTILVVSPIDSSRKQLATAIAEESDRVVITDSLEEALEEIKEGHVTEILLDFRKRSWKREFHLAIEKSGRNCPIHELKSVSELFKRPFDDSPAVTQIQATGHHILAASVACKSGFETTKAIRVGPLVERICNRMHLTRDVSSMAISIGYIQDGMRMSHPPNELYDGEKALFKLLSLAGEDFIFPTAALKVIRKMYQPVSEYVDISTAPPEVIAANVVSIADNFCDLVKPNESLTENRFNLVCDRLSSQSERLYFSETTQALLSILENDIEDTSGRKAPLILVCFGDTREQNSVKNGLRRAGFKVATCDSKEEVLSAYQKYSPDMLVLVPPPIKAMQSVKELMGAGLALQGIPTFLLMNTFPQEDIAVFLKLGVKDVIIARNNLEVLLVKARRVWENRERASMQRLEVLQDMGTHGSLSDMSVVDLIQSMGMSEKVFRVSISGHGGQLVLFLGKNRILYAECDEKLGEEAVFEALGWDSGIWSVDPVKTEDIPAENIKRTIDSLLIQGCYLIDKNSQNASTSE